MTMTTERSPKGQRRQRRRVRWLQLLFLTFSVSFVLIFVGMGLEVPAGEMLTNHHPYLLEWQAAFQKAISPALTRTPPRLIQTHNRSFTFNPITAEESAFLTQRRQDNKSGIIKAAVCHRTLFGNKVTLDPLFSFVSYYRLLGFDHIFFWYRPNIANLSRFDELSSLPYVTMTQYTGEGRDDGQLVVEEECLSNSTFAADYDWALTIDGDEYLWFNSHMSVKEFLNIYHSNYSFLSFSKWMYTMRHGVKVEEDSGFGLDSSAFTAKSHCNYDFSAPSQRQHLLPRNMTYSYCPSFRGRSKVIVKPAFHRKVNIHGMGFNLNNPGLLHFDTSVAHFKEWRGVLVNRRHGAVNYRPPVDFNASRNEVADIVDFTKAHKHVDGKVLIQYDSELQDWMRFVASGCTK